MSTRPGFVAVCKDVLTYLGGWVIIFKQAGIIFAPPPQPNEWLITLGIALIGVPGLSQLALAKFGRAMSTDEPQQPQAPSESPAVTSSGE